MSGPVRPPLTVETLDGTTVGRPITKIKVSNGSLTVSGNTATVTTGGGSGGITSFDIAGNTGPTQTIGNADTFTLVGGSAGADIKVTMSATDTATIDLQTTGVSAGSYSLATITVDAKGRITAASSGSVSVPSGANPTAEVSGTAVNGTAGTFMRSDAAPALADTAVTPGSYTYSSITVDQQGRLTAASSGTPPAVDGSGASTQVTYWQDSDTITGSSNMTFDGTNLTVGGYIKGGNVRIGDGTGEIETDNANDLVFKTNTGTDSGTLTLKSGTNGNLIFDPDGSGLLQIEGTTNPGAIKLMCEAGTHGITIESAPHSASATYKLVLPDALPADADNKYLVSDTSGNMSFTSASGGGGGVAGSDTQIQFNDGGAFGASDRFLFDATVSGGSTSGMGIKSNGSAFLSTAFVIYAEGNAYISSQVFGNEFLCSSTSVSDVGFGPQADQDTGIAFTASDQVDLVTGGAYNISFGANKEILLGGTAAGTSGQVLTSGGSGAAVSWADAGGGTTFVPNSLGGTVSTMDSELLGVGFYSPADNTPSNVQWANSLSRIRPHIMQQSGTLSDASLWVSAAPTGASTQDFEIGLWNAGTNNVPGTLKCTATISIGVGSSTGIRTGSWSASAGEDLAVKVGDLYWVGFYGTYSASSDATSLYFLQNDGISLITRRTIYTTGTSNNFTRYYASGAPSTIGDTPTISDADTQTNAAWPYIWYSVT